jgi:hypothetical protein
MVESVEVTRLPKMEANISLKNYDVSAGQEIPCLKEQEDLRSCFQKFVIGRYPDEFSPQLRLCQIYLTKILILSSI